MFGAIFIHFYFCINYASHTTLFYFSQLSFKGISKWKIVFYIYPHFCQSSFHYIDPSFHLSIIFLFPEELCLDHSLDYRSAGNEFSQLLFLCWKLFYLTFTLKNIFIENRILGWPVFFLQHFKDAVLLSSGLLSFGRLTCALRSFLIFWICGFLF